MPDTKISARMALAATGPVLAGPAGSSDGASLPAGPRGVEIAAAPG